MSETLDLFLLCAGKGARLQPLTDSCPKPLLPILGRSMADRALDASSALPVQSRVINAHHLAPEIQAFAHERQFQHIQVEPVLLDSGGALSKAFNGHKLTAPHLLAHNGDLLHDIDLLPLWETHLREGNDVTLVMIDRPAVNTVRVRNGDFTGVVGHEQFPEDLTDSVNRTFSGIAFYRTAILAGWSTRAWSIKDLWHKASREGLRVRCVDAPTNCLWEDCGTPADLARATFSLLELQGLENWIHPEAVVSPGAHLGTRVVVESHAHVETDAKLENCIIYPKARVGVGQSLVGALRNPSGEAPC
jgi:mannose-1-phosphate guanylyltransferase